MISEPGKNRRVFLIDDEQAVLDSLEITLDMAGFHHTVTCNEPENAIEQLRKAGASLVLLDLHMPKLRGDELLPQLKEEFPEIPVIIVTGINDLKTAVNCMKLGASDYIVKPVEKNELLASVNNMLNLKNAETEISNLKNELLGGGMYLENDVYPPIITRNRRMISILKYLRAIKHSDKPILITGETGVGKDLFARAIHDLRGVQGPFITVNLGGLDDNMFSDTLFGHTKGSFTGADKARKGLIDSAKGGTIFLDEIGELSVASQIKLLRLIQNSEYLPLGSDITRKANVNIICATNIDFEESIKNKTFRKDLFYRLKTHHIHIPPLKERLEDIEPLTRHFIKNAASRMDKEEPTYPSQLLALLKNYSFPGNVRELESIIDDAVSSAETNQLSLEPIKKRTGISEPAINEIESGVEAGALEFPEQMPTIAQVENIMIEEALKRFDGNQTLAAEILGISRHTLIRRIKK